MAKLELKPLLVALLVTTIKCAAAAASPSPAITSAPEYSILARQFGNGDDPCSGLDAILSSCQVETSGFNTLRFNQQASCVCYQGSRFVPSRFDSLVQTCTDYLRTESPARYSSVSERNPYSSPCARLASQTPRTSPSSSTTAAAVTITPQSTSTPSSVDQSRSIYLSDYTRSCTSFYSLYSSCGAATPSFDALGFGVQASCLCYTGTTWAPQIFDSYWETCLSFRATAESAAVTETGSDAVLSTPCAAAGNLRGGPSLIGGAGVVSTSSGVTGRTTTGSSMSTATVSTGEGGAAPTTDTNPAVRNRADWSVWIATVLLLFRLIG